MKFELYYLCTILFFKPWQSDCLDSKDLHLELVQVLFRHGARTPSESEARYINVTDPTIYKPYGFYQLTNKGKDQVHKLGVFLRQRYDQFLGPYQPNDVYAYSSGSTRTIMSLQLVFAGLFPPINGEKWNEKLNWRPIPMYRASGDRDVLLTPHQFPKFKELHEKEITEFFRVRLEPYAEFIKFLQEKTGIRFEKNLIYHFGWTYYAISIHKEMNLPLPNWCTNEVLQKLEELLHIGLDSMSLTQKLKRINGGTLVRRIIENINDYNNHTNPKKIYLYSAHDLTLAGFSRAQNLTYLKIPDFGSAIVMEKYRDNQNTEYMRAVAWDGSDKSFTPLKIADCEEYCLLSRYLTIVENVIPSDEDLKFLTGVRTV